MNHDGDRQRKDEREAGRTRQGTEASQQISKIKSQKCTYENRTCM